MTFKPSARIESLISKEIKELSRVLSFVRNTDDAWLLVYCYLKHIISCYESLLPSRNDNPFPCHVAMAFDPLYTWSYSTCKKYVSIEVGGDVLA